MNHIFVTGATGRVGTNLVKALLERGYRVRSGVMREDPKREKLQGLDTEVVAADLTDPQALDRAVEGVDAVIHTACVMGRPPSMSRSEYFDINVKGTFYLLDAASRRADRLAKFVYISSDSVYPAAYDPCYTPVDENHPKRPYDDYMLIKNLCEQMVLEAWREHGLQATILRPGAIAAGTEILNNWTAGLVRALMERAARAKRGPLYLPHDPQPWASLFAQVESPQTMVVPRDPEGRPWLWHRSDVRDVVHGILCGLESEAAVGEAFNIFSPEPISFATAVPYLAEKTGQSYVEWTAPVQWIYACDNTKAKTLIGFRPQYDVYRMLDDALALQAGKDIGVIPA